jgi:hypothetical protein
MSRSMSEVAAITSFNRFKGWVRLLRELDCASTNA